MRSNPERRRASPLILAAAALSAAAPPEAAPPPEVAAAQGPRATAGAGEGGYDIVALATGNGGAPAAPTTASAITAAHRTLPPGTIVEVTALDTGRTILVRIDGRGPDDPRYEIALSRGAAALLGITGDARAVRIRPVIATPADAAALEAGRPAAARLDAPAALLVALRRRQGTAMPVAPPMRRIAPPVAPSVTPLAAPVAAPSPRGGTTPNPRGPVVQIAAFTSEARATTLARALGGSIRGEGGFWRVRLGPYADRRAAQRARDDAAKRGYGDARIVSP